MHLKNSNEKKKAQLPETNLKMRPFSNSTKTGKKDVKKV